jgi:uncharacterized protein (DUF2141 family)
MNARILGTALVAGASLLASTATGEPAKTEPPPSTNEIRFTMSVANPKGHVLCGLFRKVGWLKKAVQAKKATIRDGEAECVFSSVMPDVYALSAIHDENDNGRLDTNFLGIPTESWCTSRDAKAFFGPPSFDDAKFRYAGSVLRLRSSLE